MEKSYFKCFRLFLDTWKKITDVNLKAQYYESLLEYGLNGVKPDNPIIDALLTSAMYSIDRTDEIKEQKSEYMKGNSNASKNWENIQKQRKTDTNRNKQTKTYEEIKKNKEDIEVIEDKEDIKKEKLLKRKYLDFVLLTDDEHTKLVNQLWDRLTTDLIDKLNNYIWSTWKRYRSHYFTILQWSKKEQTHTQTNIELLKERERQRIREEAQEILNRNKNTNGTTIQNPTYNRRTDLQSC